MSLAQRRQKPSGVSIRFVLASHVEILDLWIKRVFAPRYGKGLNGHHLMFGCLLLGVFIT